MRALPLSSMPIFAAEPVLEQRIGVGVQVLTAKATRLEGMRNTYHFVTPGVLSPGRRTCIRPEYHTRPCILHSMGIRLSRQRVPRHYEEPRVLHIAPQVLRGEVEGCKWSLENETLLPSWYGAHVGRFCPIWYAAVRFAHLTFPA